MADSKALKQEDVVYLFWLDYGRIKELPASVADRLMAHGLVNEAAPLQGAQVLDRATMHLTVSQDGRYLIEMIRTGRDSRFRIPGL